MERLPEASRPASHVFDLPDAALVSSALKGCVQPDIDDRQRQVLVDKPGTERDYVGVVMFLGEASGHDIPAERATDAMHLIGHHRFTVAASAQDNTGVARAAGHAKGGRADEVGIVDRLIAVRAEVVDGIAPVSEAGGKALFQLVPRVIRGYGDGFHLLLLFGELGRC